MRQVPRVFLPACDGCASKREVWQTGAENLLLKSGGVGMQRMQVLASSSV